MVTVINFPQFKPRFVIVETVTYILEAPNFDAAKRQYENMSPADIAELPEYSVFNSLEDWTT